MKKMSLITLMMTSILSLSFILSTKLSAQEVNYTEVNVFGWGQALDRGAPAVTDIDNDGYLDLLVGNNDGKIWHLEQASGDEFALISKHFCEIDVGSEAVPTFTNINNNGLIDLLVGDNSDLTWFEQQDTNSNTFVFQSDQLISVNIGAHWTPACADLNNDGLLELIIGESLGTLWYFEQDSLNAGTFSLVEESWMDWDGGIYVHPHFTDLDNDGLLDLLVGNNSGKIFHLVQDDSNATTFTEVSNHFGGIDIGESAAPCIADIDHDKKLDLFIGEWYNGLYHYEQTDSISHNYLLVSDKLLGVRDFGYSIDFTVEDIDGDGLLDMLIGAYKGADSYIMHYEQQEEASLNFQLLNESFCNIPIGQYSNLVIYDINENGLADLFISDGVGYVTRYEQDEVNSYQFSLADEEFNNNMKLNQSGYLTFGDMDGDSLIDMIAGEGNGYLYYYEQDSARAVTFTKQIDRFLDVRYSYYSAPVFTDIDGDSLVDIIIAHSNGLAKYYEQASVHSSEFLLKADEFGSAYYGNRTTMQFVDVNLDGKTDMFVAENAGGITLHLRNDDLDVTAPDIPQNVTATINNNYVDLSWSPSQADDLLLYNIYRSIRNDTSVAEYIYSVDYDATAFTDTTLTESGTYYYWLTALDHIGNESGFSSVDSVSIVITGFVDVPETGIEKFALHQNYPNPFNPRTMISFTLPETEFVQLKIYNQLGQEVEILVSNILNTGDYRYEWDASSYSSGVYYYRLVTESGFLQTKKLIVLK